MRNSALSVAIILARFYSLKIASLLQEVESYEIAFVSFLLVSLLGCKSIFLVLYWSEFHIPNINVIYMCKRKSFTRRQSLAGL